MAWLLFPKLQRQFHDAEPKNNYKGKVTFTKLLGVQNKYQI